MKALAALGLLAGALVAALALLEPWRGFAGRDNPALIAHTSQDESLPVAGRGVVAWTVGGGDALAPTSVWVKEGSAEPHRLPVGGDASGVYSGALDGTRLALQVTTPSGSELELYDLGRKRLRRLPLPPSGGRLRGQPALSGRYLAYIESSDWGPVLIAADLRTGHRRAVRAQRGHTRLVVGQAAGRWLVFTIESRPGDRYMQAAIARYDFVRHTISYIRPPAGKEIHAPSVTPDGTVYYVEASRCRSATFVRRRGRRLTRLARIEGRAVGSTYAVQEGSSVSLYYDAWPVEEATCELDGDADVYRLTVR